MLVKRARLDRPPELPWYKPVARQPRFFTEDEVALVMQTFRNWSQPRVADFFLFLVQTGLRPWAEAAKATWGDFRGRTVTVLGKNNQLRTVPLLPEAYEAVQRQPKTGKGPWSDFADRHAMDKLWLEIRAHLPQLHDTVWYTCRHTCASWMAIRGVDLRRIQIWMGHLRLEQTLTYANLMPNHLMDVVDIMSAPGQKGRHLRVVEAVDANPHTDQAGVSVTMAVTNRAAR